MLWPRRERCGVGRFSFSMVGDGRRGPRNVHITSTGSELGGFGEFKGNFECLACMRAALLESGAVAYTKCRFWPPKAQIAATDTPAILLPHHTHTTTTPISHTQHTPLISLPQASHNPATPQQHHRHHPATHLPTPPGYAAGQNAATSMQIAPLSNICCRGYAARAMLQGLCCAQGGRRTTR